jgi:hypothetical protein
VISADTIVTSDSFSSLNQPCRKTPHEGALQEWQAHNSYNQNGRYYTLPDVPEYDANGLWCWCGVFFSRAGTLNALSFSLHLHPIHCQGVA